MSSNQIISSCVTQLFIYHSQLYLHLNLNLHLSLTYTDTYTLTNDHYQSLNLSTLSL